jgi:SAM-dependent methyltransferase
MGDTPQGPPAASLPWRTARAVLKTFSRVAPGQRGRLQKVMIGAGYSLISRFGKAESGPTFMNFGYATDGAEPRALALDGSDQADGYYIQLYHRVAGAVDLQGKDVLEVGSGRGGGASFVTRYLKPRSMTGVDYAASAIAFCRRRHHLAGLSFVRGDAEKLPLPDSSFDVVVNVESSHCYPSFDRFIDEVRRVLRPGGHFLFADIRLADALPGVRDAMRQRFTIESEESITANVVRALDLDTDRRRALIADAARGALQRPLENMSALRGTRTFEGLVNGRLEYFRMVLRKSAEPEVGQ